MQGGISKKEAETQQPDLTLFVHTPLSPLSTPRAALNRKILPLASDTLEAQQIKAMVEGMKDDLRRFVKAGGTIAEYGRRLVQRQERQEEELKYYNLVKNELDAAAAAQMPQHELLDLWERRNEDLRQMGIRLVPMPE